jgi:hypothetical protein
MIIAITGGRDFYPKPSSGAAFIAWCVKSGVTVVRDGECETGVDHVIAAALKLAAIPGLRSDQWPALWKVYGKPGGPRRNGKMCEGDRSDWDLPNEPPIEKLVAWPGNAGTANCRGCARRVGARIIEIAEIEAWHLRALVRPSP